MQNIGERSSDEDNAGSIENVQRALEFSEEKYRKAFYLTPDSMNINRLEDGLFVSINQGFTAITGFTEADVFGKTSFEIDIWADPHDRNRLVQILRSEGQVRDFEAQFRTKKGEILDGLMSAAVIQLGDVGHIISVTRDITERKQAEIRLQQSEDKYRQLADGMPVFIETFAPGGTVTFANEALARLVNMNASQLVGMNFFDFLNAFDRQVVQSALAQLTPEHPNETHEQTYQGPDGGIGYHQWTNRAFFDENGRVTHYQAVGEDITERKLSEAALIASEARWKFAIEGSGDGLWDWNIQTGKAYFSPRYKTLLGFAEDKIGETADEWTKRIHPDDAPGVYAALQPYMDGKPGSAAVEFRMLCKDGSWMWTKGRGMVVERDAEGKPLRMIGTNSDITERKLTENHRRDQHELLQTILATALDGYWLADRQGRLLDVNDAASAMLGYSRQELLGLNVSDIEVVDSQEFIDKRMRRMERDGGDLFESLHRRKDGTILHVEVSIRYLPLKSALSVFVRDITQRKLAEGKLQLAASVFGHAREGITITDAQGTILDINEAFTRITGYSREDSIGKSPRILSSGRQEKSFYQAMWSALTHQGHWSGEIWNRRKDGEVYAELLTISAVRDGDGKTQQYVGLFSDITTIKEHQRQLEHIAHFDALTNLPNRLLLADRLQQAMAQAQRRSQKVAVAYLDLDGFKNVNDQHGHDMGDKLLIHLATAMKDTLREGDTLARLGGDEFVAVLIDLNDIDSCVPMLTRLLEAAAAPVQFGSVVLKGSASIGVTLYPQSQEMEADQLLRQADQAMYQAKLAGKNRFQVFDDANDSNLRIHHESLERIRVALAHDEFVLHYQPKVNMHSGQVIGAEALIRWCHPEKGLLLPATFLPVIENHPLAVEVGEWVIDTALTQIAHWHASGLNVDVSVNVGALQLQNGDFVRRLQSILAKHPDVSPTCLELEVLETSALGDMEQVSQVIEDCHQMGVKFALDDFGTGYSSLTYLKRLHVSQLKIDQSFVRDMLDDSDDLAILEGVIGLAAAFKREVIAEGVETIQHGTALLHLGCELAQGFGIARPMPPEQMSAWVSTWQPDEAWCAVLSSVEAKRPKSQFSSLPHRT